MPVSQLIRNQQGIALYYIILMFTLMGVLVSAGVRMLGSTVNLGKNNETKAELERGVQMITAWSIRNGHWPAFKDYSASIFGSRPLDAWGQPLVYAYYSSPTSSSSNELCGRTASDITHETQPVSFLLLSGGDKMSFSTYTTPKKSGAFSGDLGIARGQIADIRRIVTLKELQAMAGCDGATQGKLKILNNELPSVCVGSTSYDATVYASGGVPNYTWSNTPNPGWLVTATTGSNRKLSKSASAIIASAPNLTFSLTDFGGNAVTKKLPINVVYTGTCASKLNVCTAELTCFTECAANADCSAAFAANQISRETCAANADCSAACAANPACSTACAANPACATACPDCI